MKVFEAFPFDLNLCRNELAEFKALLGSNTDLAEAQHILPFLASHRHLAAFVGSFNPNVHVYDRFAVEYDLFGDFTCDLAIGDSEARAYTLVEFEDAARYSLFQHSASYSPPWSTRFEHGFSQIIDWFWKLEDQQKTDEFRHRFGDGNVRFFGMLVNGRSAHLDPRGRARLDWRSDRVVVNSRSILCLTYDDLCRRLERKMDQLSGITPARPAQDAAKGVEGG
jgi:hypothetical protein